MESDFELVIAGTQIKKLAEQSCEKLMAERGIRKIELDILYFISCIGVDTETEIVNLSRISKAHISKSVDNLRRCGYIELFDDEHDHRCTHIRITPAGIPVVREFERIRMEIVRRIFRGIDENEKECMKVVVGKLLYNVSHAT